MLLSAVVGLSAGCLIGQVCMNARIERVQTNPQAIQGDVGSYLCAAGDLLVLFGMLGAIVGTGIGLSGSLMGWLWGLKSNSKPG
jgi:hypothetical protein